MPTILLVHEGSLWRVGDALPDGDGLGVAGVHGFHFFTVPPIPTNDEIQHTHIGEKVVGALAADSHPSLPVPWTLQQFQS